MRFHCGEVGSLTMRHPNPWFFSGCVLFILFILLFVIFVSSTFAFQVSSMLVDKIVGCKCQNDLKKTHTRIQPQDLPTLYFCIHGTLSLSANECVLRDLAYHLTPHSRKDDIPAISYRSGAGTYQGKAGVGGELSARRCFCPHGRGSQAHWGRHSSNGIPI